MLTHLEFRNGRILTKEEALAAALAEGEVDGFTYELLAALLAEQQERGDRISTTYLLSKCPRGEFLQRTRDYSVKPGALWAAFRGTMLHGRLENHAHPRNIAEARYYVELDGLGELSGSPDLVDPVLGILDDYKTCGPGKAPRFGGPWDEHVAQVQINRWLVDHAYKVEYDGEEYWLDDPKYRWRFVPPNWLKLRIIYLDVDKGPQIMDCTKSIQVPAKKGGTKAMRVPDIWDDDRVRELVRSLYAERVLTHSTDEVPAIPPGFERQGHVLCGYCPVKAMCWDLALEEAATSSKRSEAV